MPDIFISYRRDDSSGYAGRLFDQISAHFGADHVFMDVAAIHPGSDFGEVIEKRIANCDALIALIGKNWLTIKDEQGHVRLGKSGDFVSTEIAAALKRNVEVIPVLVGGARMPLEAEMPELLQPLCRRQALEIGDVNFTRDVGDLVEALKSPGGARTTGSPQWVKPAVASIIGVCVLAAGIGIWAAQNRHPPAQANVPVVIGDSAAASDAALPAASPKIANNGIAGNWRAVVQKDDVNYEIYFTFEVMDRKLLGRVVYPTGEAGILNGTFSQNRISFTTKHVPNFADEEITITVEGRVSGDQIEVFVQDKDGYSKGVAHRVAQIGRPKVLSPR